MKPATRKPPGAEGVKPCPICSKPRSPEFTPFCSRRCADVDLYRWLKGGYVIPGSERGSKDDSQEDE